MEHTQVMDVRKGNSVSSLYLARAGSAHFSSFVSLGSVLGASASSDWLFSQQAVRGGPFVNGRHGGTVGRLKSRNRRACPSLEKQQVLRFSHQPNTWEQQRPFPPSAPCRDREERRGQGGSRSRGWALRPTSPSFKRQ
ncbi:hypothetical protein SKAU_G00303740 [Synaphobranchus kaupii]|uniref:Uncharacterized protein n=1 Tax=Synaphobranchus kaupii TaxID=118154 RepID=A0A9Q1INJ6_SYNKA|nr:hypothetical protein SKAU_G00303740 [Synaphobranchus kaupii]